MIHRTIILIAVLFCVFNGVESFLPKPFRPVKATSLQMSSTESLPKSKSLKAVKARSIGRFDLASMVEEDEEETYKSFLEADNEEVDPPKIGQTVTGTIIEIDDNGALLEIGGKMSGYLPIKEASLIPIKHLNERYEIGSEVTAEVIGTLKGMPVISLRPTELVSAWENILNIRAADSTFDAKVLDVNRGGAVCEIFGLDAFLPGSHYMGTPDESMIGMTLKVQCFAVSV